MKVKRRKFLQYAGLGSVGLVFADLERAIASALSEAAGSQDLKLETFSFSVATLDANGQINQQQRHTDKFFLAVNNSLMAKQVEKGSKDDSNDH